MKNLYCFLFFLLTFLTSKASHIVGGEISVVPTTTPNSSHRITLNLYFDQRNGRAEAEDRQITVVVFRRKDNVQMGTVVLPQLIRESIKYIVPGCEIGDVNLQTLFMSYAADVNFPAATYNDPQGYYVVWERCCRNVIVTNIVDPSSNGMVFFTEFPPVTTTNSSPVFKKIVADYICSKTPFEMDFNATDADGDSLVYSMVTPWKGFNGRGNAQALAKGSDFYPEVVFINGSTIQKQIPGIDPLSITTDTGVLTVETDIKGLFVFSIMVEEFRKGKRIGRVKRDFQLQVIDCQTNLPPAIRVKNLNDGKFYASSQIVTLKNKEKRCFEAHFTDPDVGQSVKLSAKALNFDQTRISLNVPDKYLIKSKTDTLKIQFCLDDCAITKSGLPLEIQFTVEDNGCPVPVYRRFLMRILQDQTGNARPEIYSEISKDNIEFNVNFGDVKRFNIIASEADGDSLFVTARGRGFALADAGIDFKPINGFKSLTMPLTIDADCKLVRKYAEFRAKNQQLIADFTVTESRCGIKQTRDYSVLFNVAVEENKAPVVTTSLATKTVEYNINPQGKNEVKFNVFANDPNTTQTITLLGQPRGFDLKSADMSFDNKTGKGSLSSPFAWTPSCKTLNGKESIEYFVKFVTQDNSCFTNNNDSLTVKLVLKDQPQPFGEVKPYNVFTPNGDGINDYFTLGVVPGDNCRRQFKKFEIFNRWGRIVYKTEERNFQWDGNNNPAGDYFYSVYFSDDTYKGVLKIIK